MSTGRSTPRRRRRFTPRVVPVGDAAQMLELAAGVDLDANALARRVADDVRRADVAGVVDVVIGVVSVTVYFEAADPAQSSALRHTVGELLAAALARAGQAADETERTPVEIPVCYEAACAPDLPEVAAATGLSVQDVVRLHTDSPHRVLMLGFAPGFPYIGGLDPRLDVPRRATPRARLAAGSVAIANGQTAIYPFDTPGGWNLIGRTPLQVFDPGRDPPSLLQAGDRVRFVPISASEFERRAAQADRR